MTFQLILRNRLFLIQIMVLICTLAANGTKIPLTLNQLREKHGQASLTSKDDLRNCNRLCDGSNKLCYYEFNAQMYEAMSSGVCKNCTNGKIADCFVENCIPANGMSRTLMSLNQQLPGPSINVCEGDRIIVDVKNSMDGHSLTIHWHGIFQKDTPYMDGVPMVTQCPIASGSTFRYDFVVQQCGTYFYHAHTGIQRINGLNGVFTVRTPNDLNADAYDTDSSENTIFLLDWDNSLAEEKSPGTGTSRTAPLPDSVLINGFGNYLDPDSGTYAFAPIPVFYAERGKRNLFRLVNARSDACISQLSILNQELTVIATDGNAIEPIVVDSIISTPGERFDFVITAPYDPNIIQTLLTVQLLDICEPHQLQEFARIIFVDDIMNVQRSFEHHEPLIETPPFEGLDDSKRILNNPFADCTDANSYCISGLTSKQSPNSPIENLREISVTKVIPLAFAQVHDQDRSANYISDPTEVMMATINNIANMNAAAPPLIQGDFDVPYCNEETRLDSCMEWGTCHCVHLIELNLCEVYELLLFDASKDDGQISHPSHLHGYHFQILDTGTLEQLQSGETAFANATNLPVLKDTVLIPPVGFVRIRFRACNPGYWFFHCHYEYHMWTGMTLTFKVGREKDFPTIPTNFPRCGNFLPPTYE